jgi:hypothetical protein
MASGKITNPNGKLNNSGVDFANEARRRQKATVTGGGSTLETGEEYNRPFQTPDQLVFLWNFANKNQRPKSIRPAFRILGLFPSSEEAFEHGRRVMRADPESPCAIRVGSTHAWYTLAKDMYEDIEPYKAKVERNLELHKQRLARDELEFTRRKKALTKGTKPSYQAKRAADQNERRLTYIDKKQAAAAAGDDEEVRRLQAEEALLELQAQQETRAEQAAEGDFVHVVPEEDEVGEYEDPPLPRIVQPEEADATWREEVEKTWGSEGVPVSPIAVNLEVRNQKYVSVSILHDYEGNGEEPGVIVWGAFDSEAEAVKYNRLVVAKELKEHDACVVAMYEWIYPHLQASDSIEQLYRNEELNNIMKHARNSARTVRSFEGECATQGVDVPRTEVVPDLEQPAPRLYKRPEDGSQEGDDPLKPSEE